MWQRKIRFLHNGCNYVNSLTNNIHEWYLNITPEEKLYMETVRELIEVRDGRKVIVGLNRTELLDLLVHMYFFVFFMF